MDKPDEERAGGKPEDVGKPSDTPGFGPPPTVEPQDGSSGSEPPEPPVGGPDPKTEP